MLPFGRTSGAILDKLYPLYYPPSLTGLRGSHPGSNTHAHARAWEGRDAHAAAARQRSGEES